MEDVGYLQIFGKSTRVTYPTGALRSMAEFSATRGTLFGREYSFDTGKASRAMDLTVESNENFRSKREILFLLLFEIRSNIKLIHIIRVLAEFIKNTNMHCATQDLQWASERKDKTDS